MSELFEYRHVTRCIVGTVGQPGERAFFLQVSSPHSISTIAMEKSQASALVERFQQMIKELRKQHGVVEHATVPKDDMPLQSPFDIDFIAGDMSVLWLPDDGTIQLEIKELAHEENTSSSLLRISLSLQQIKEFVRRTEAVINAGRTPCMFCGLPINPEGHLCPRANGYRR